jgi:uncharacterized protein YsxB (DUF464 family)
MIVIEVTLDEGGLLRSCDVKGHAGAGKRGGDIVCAAVSVLSRTALRALSGRKGIVVRGGAPDRGVFRIETEVGASGREFLSGAGTFLIEGLRSVAEEYPDCCKMTIYTN